MRASLALQAKPLIEAAARARMESGKAADPKENLPEGSGQTRDAVADMAGISGRTVDKVEAVLEHGSPELIEAAKERQRGGQGGVLLVEKLPQASEKTRDAIADMVGISGEPLIADSARGLLAPAVRPK